MKTEIPQIREITPREGSKLIYSEGINYFDTGHESIWGEEGATILRYIDKADPRGNWLNLASGDGRYCKRLLHNASSLTVADIDAGALSKLWHRMTPSERNRLSLVKLNLTDTLPFQNSSFDGVFCIGTLHFFEEKVLKEVFSEIKRIVGPRGKFLFNFGTNIERLQPNGEKLVYPREPQHKLGMALGFLNQSLTDFNMEFHVENTRIIPFMEANPPYTYSSDIVVALGEKK